MGGICLAKNYLGGWVGVFGKSFFLSPIILLLSYLKAGLMQTAPTRLRLNNIALCCCLNTKFKVRLRINLGLISIRSIPSRKNQLHQVESATIAGLGGAKNGRKTVEFNYRPCSDVVQTRVLQHAVQLQDIICQKFCTIDVNPD